MSTEWITRTLTIPNRDGLHMRPAIRFVHFANKFEADVLVERRGFVADGKSIMQVSMFCAVGGDKIILKTKGADATKAIKVLSALVQDGFGSNLNDPEAWEVPSKLK